MFLNSANNLVLFIFRVLCTQRSNMTQENWSIVIQTLLVFRRKDLCEAKHDVVCVWNFAQNWTLWGGGKSSLQIWGKSSLPIWGKSSLPNSGGGKSSLQIWCKSSLLIYPQITKYQLHQIVGFTPPEIRQWRFTPNLQWRFTPPQSVQFWAKFQTHATSCFASQRSFLRKTNNSSLGILW